MAFHYSQNGRPTPGIPVVGRREPPMSLSLNIASLRTSQAFHQGEGHVDFHQGEGRGRPPRGPSIIDKMEGHKTGLHSSPILPSYTGLRA